MKCLPSDLLGHFEHWDAQLFRTLASGTGDSSEQVTHKFTQDSQIEKPADFRPFRLLTKA